MSAGKGDKPRPVNGEVFRRNYEAIFGKNNFAAVIEGGIRAERPEPSQHFNASNETGLEGGK